jgi:aminopeptidase N
MTDSVAAHRIDANTVRVPNLTHEDASLRASLLRVESYKVSLDLTDADGGATDHAFRSRTEVVFDCNRPGASTFIDLIAERFHEVTLNGHPVDVSNYDPADGIVLPDLAAHNVLVVDAETLYTTVGQGLHRFTDPADGQVYLYSQCETSDAKRLFACFDQPDIKGTFTLSVTIPAAWHAISNGAVQQVEDDEETKTVHFATTPRLSTYLTALVAGPYHEVRDHHDGIDLGLFCRASLAEHLDAEELFDTTKRGFDWYHRNFGVRYPFGKYDQLFVPEFNAGAMENAGCVTFRDEYIFRSRVTDERYERRASTVLHEMAHMWFGDLVTMRWFDDLWLNESFADWAATASQAEATRWTNAWATFANKDKTWAYRQDQLPSTHPIACSIPDVEAVEVNFDGITYAKGASVIKQLVYYVGWDKFMAGIRSYFEKNAYGNTTLAEFLAALNESSGRELTQWAKVWLETSGLNTIRADFEVAEDGTFSSFALLQETPTHTSKDNVLRPHRLAIGLYSYDESGALVRTGQVEADLDGERTDIPELVGARRPDLVLVNDDDHTYCKARLDDHSLATLRSGGLAALTDTLARSLCWTSAWDMVRDGELATRHYLDLVLNAAPSETDIGMLDTVQRQVVRALEIFADPATVEEGRTRLANLSIRSAREAAPGSDHQFAWLHSAILSAQTPQHAAFLKRILTGEEVLEGLTVDTDLRWALVQALVARGAAGEDEIDAELSRDHTAAGERAAATARALTPTLDAKTKAFETAMHDESLSNAIMRAIVAGFHSSVQGDLLEPFVEKYFDVAAEVWETRSSEMGQALIVGMFPTWSSAITESTVELADRLLARPALPGAFRRLVSEGRADVVRALNARRTDIAAGVTE